VAVLHVSAADLPGKARPMEFAWRVDGGLWSTWFDGPRLEVEHPALIMPGHHRLEVRARIAGEPALVGVPGPPVTFVSDWEPPRVRLTADHAAGLVTVEASDGVTGPQGLSFAYRVGEGALSPFGAARPIDLAAAQAAGGVEVQVRDEAGLVGVAAWRTPQAAAVSGKVGAVGAAAGSAAPESGAGCTAAGPGLSLLAVGLLPFALRRRSRR
jgi:hypothetical protein